VHTEAPFLSIQRELLAYKAMRTVRYQAYEHKLQHQDADGYENAEMAWVNWLL